MDLLAEKPLGLVYCELGDLRAIRRVRPVGSEQEEPVEVARHQFHPSRPLHRPGHDAECDAGVAEGPERGSDAVQHSIPGCVLELVREAEEIRRVQSCELFEGRRAPDRRLERRASDEGVGLAGGRVRPDVGPHAVQALEGIGPASSARAAGVDEGSVDVEEGDDGQSPDLHLRRATLSPPTAARIRGHLGSLRVRAIALSYPSVGRGKREGGARRAPQLARLLAAIARQPTGPAL